MAAISRTSLLQGASPTTDAPPRTITCVMPSSRSSTTLARRDTGDTSPRRQPTLNQRVTFVIRSPQPPVSLSSSRFHQPRTLITCTNAKFDTSIEALSDLLDIPSIEASNTAIPASLGGPGRLRSKVAMPLPTGCALFRSRTVELVRRTDLLSYDVQYPEGATYPYAE